MNSALLEDYHNYRKIYYQKQEVSVEESRFYRQLTYFLQNNRYPVQGNFTLYKKLYDILRRKDHLFPLYITEFKKFFFKRIKNLLWSVVKFLSLHHRAVITANHPERKLLRGEFLI
jgi:hypothetical protein